jgi:hypothetical protein
VPQRSDTAAITSSPSTRAGPRDPLPRRRVQLIRYRAAVPRPTEAATSHADADEEELIETMSRFPRAAPPIRVVTADDGAAGGGLTARRRPE